MLLGYLLLLREAAKADAERRDLILSRAAHAARAEARRRAQPPVVEVEAEVIAFAVAPSPPKSSTTSTPTSSAARWATDLTGSGPPGPDPQGLRAAERDVRVEGQLLVRGQPQVRVAAG